MTSLVIPSDAARARSVSRFCLFYALASLPLPVGSASPVGGGMQCAAACAPGAHPFNLETTSGEIPLSPRRPLIGPVWVTCSFWTNRWPGAGISHPLGPGRQKEPHETGVGTTDGRTERWADRPTDGRRNSPSLALGKSWYKSDLETEKAVMESNQGGGLKRALLEEVTLTPGPCRMSRSLGDIGTSKREVIRGSGSS